MRYELKTLDNDTISELIELSKKWQEEDCSWGIIANEKDDLKEPLFLAIDDRKIVGYIFGAYSKLPASPCVVWIFICTSLFILGAYEYLSNLILIVLESK